MRILEFFGMIPPEYGGKHTGGADYVVWELSKTFARRGHDVYMLPTIPYKGGTYEKVKVVNEEAFNRKVLFESRPMTNRLLLKIGKKYCFDSNYIKSLAVQYRIYSKFIKKLLDKIKPEVLHFHGITIDRFVIIESALESNLPIILTLHGLLGFDPPSGLSNAPTDMKCRKEYEKFALSYLINKRSDIVITTVSSGIYGKLIEEYDISKDKIYVVLNGIDEKFFNPSNKNKYELRKRFRIMEGRKSVFLSVGTFSERKNQILVLKALEYIGDSYDIEYLAVGMGAKISAYNEFIKIKRLKNAKIVGFLHGQDLIDIYHTADFFILTPLSEAFGLVFLEAMAAGLPIITMKNLDAIDDIYDERAFVLIDKYSPEAVANAMIKAINMEWDRNYIKSIARKFLWENIARKYLDIFRMAIERNKGDEIR